MTIRYEVQANFCKDNTRDEKGELKRTPRECLWIKAESIEEVDVIKELIPTASYMNDGVFLISKYI